MGKTLGTHMWKNERAILSTHVDAGQCPGQDANPSTWEAKEGPTLEGLQSGYID